MNAYGKLYRKARSEALRVELQKAIARIEAATHVVVYKNDGRVCSCPRRARIATSAASMPLPGAPLVSQPGATQNSETPESADSEI